MKTEFAPERRLAAAVIGSALVDLDTKTNLNCEAVTRNYEAEFFFGTAQMYFWCRAAGVNPELVMEKYHEIVKRRGEVQETQGAKRMLGRELKARRAGA
jgi:hypothetical protein